MGQQRKVAIITGANAGVGLGIAQRLLEVDENNMTTIVMACRNHARASTARDRLLHQFPEADIVIELVDTGSVASVFRFCDAIKSRYGHVNYVFCNAGILSALGLLSWTELFWLFVKDPVGLVEKSDATLQATGEINDDGMGTVFATNVFGHYVMVRELESLLNNSGDGRVIWTSSITAELKSFDIEDWQGIKSLLPYESSKRACDLVALATHDKYKQDEKHISCYTTSPGVVASTIGNFPRWITELRKLAHYFFRFVGVTSQNITGYRGAIADVFVALQPLSALNYLYRYTSLTSRWGTSYVEALPVGDYDPQTAEKLVEKCELAYQAWKNKSTPEKH